MPERALDLTPSTDAVWNELRRLPDRQRAAVVLRYYEDLADDDIAQLLGCRPATVRSLLHRALARLGEVINEPSLRTPSAAPCTRSPDRPAPPAVSRRPSSERVVPISSWRPTRTQRMVLGAVAAVIAVVAGVLVAALVTGDGRPGHRRDRRRHVDHDATATSSTSTLVDIVHRDDGDDRDLVRSGIGDDATAAPSVRGLGAHRRRHVRRRVAGVPQQRRGLPVRRARCRRTSPTRSATSSAPEEPLGAIRTMEVPQPDGSVRVLFIAAVGDGVDAVERFPGAQINGRAQLGRIEDPFIDGLSFLVTDQVAQADVAHPSQRPGSRGRASTAFELRTDAPFGRVPGYGKGAESLSIGLLQEIGAVSRRRRHLRPRPPAAARAAGHRRRLHRADRARSARRRRRPCLALVDLFGIAPEAAAGDWVCELPDGDSCGSGLATVVAGSSAAALSGFGPISVVDSNGDRVDHVVIVLADETRFEVPIPSP